MAKKATLSEVTNTYNNTPVINQNLEAINDKLDNTISRDGSTPNEMNSDLDMNSNDIINVDNIDVENITIGGKTYTTAIADASAAAEAAGLSAEEAALYDGVRFDTFADFIASNLTFTAGQLVQIRDIGATYEAVAGVGTGNLGQTNAGGQEFDVFPESDGFHNVLHFGAVGDGATSDVSAFERASAAASQYYGAVRAPKDYVWYLPGGVLLNQVGSLSLGGTIRGSTSTDRVVLRYISTSAAPSHWYVERADACTLVFQGLANCTGTVLYADKLLLEADGSNALIRNIAYNTFHLGFIGILELNGLTNTPTSWINSNKFFGARCADIRLTGVYPHNNNTFYGFKSEFCTITIDAVDASGKGASSNIFYDMRLEGSCTFNFGAGTEGNLIVQSWYQFFRNYPERKNAAHTINDLGIGNGVVSSFDAHWSERQLCGITSMSKDHHVEVHSADRAGTVTTLINNRIFYDTGLIPLDHVLAFRIKADAAKFNPEIYAYDASGAIITTAVLTTVATAMPFDGVLNRYRTPSSTPQAEWTILIPPTSGVDFIQYVVKSSTSGGGTFGNFELSMFEPRGKFATLACPNFYDGRSGFVSNAKPASGTFQVGDTVHNRNRTVVPDGTSDYVITGWQRLTAGSGHVLNTDWAELRCFTGT